MKRSINYVLTFILMIVVTFLFVLVLTEFQLSKTNIKNILKSNNYYELAHDNILEKVDDYIVNEEVKKLYNEYITIEMIKNDIINIVNSIYDKKDSNVDHYDDFYKIINTYTNDSNINNVYASSINEIYISNLFPVREFEMINRLYFSGSTLLFITLVTLLIALVISLLMFFLNKNFKQHFLSLISSSLILIIPFSIIRVTNLFDNFVYTNEYYTILILSILINIVFSIFMLGLIILIGVFMKIFCNKNNN